MLDKIMRRLGYVPLAEYRKLKLLKDFFKGSLDEACNRLQEKPDKISKKSETSETHQW